MFGNLTKMQIKCTEPEQNVDKIFGNLNTGNDVASVEPCSQLETFVRPVGHNKPSTLGQN